MINIALYYAQEHNKECPDILNILAERNNILLENAILKVQMFQLLTIQNLWKNFFL
jgi:hypothetical protein